MRFYYYVINRKKSSDFLDEDQNKVIGHVSFSEQDLLELVISVNPSAKAFFVTLSERKYFIFELTALNIPQQSI